MYVPNSNLFHSQDTEGIEKLEIRLRQKDSSEAQLVWSLPYNVWTDPEQLWHQGQVEVRAPEDPNYLYRVIISKSVLTLLFGLPKFGDFFPKMGTSHMVKMTT
jgi:hypothetical protein